MSRRDVSPDYARARRTGADRGADGAGGRRELRSLGAGPAVRAGDARARRSGLGRVVRDRAARRALRSRRHRHAAGHARQPARAVRRHLRPESRGARGRADGDRRLDPRQRSARARPGDRDRRSPISGRDHALLQAPAPRHRHPAAGDRLHHRAARPLARRTRSRQPPRRCDLRGRRRLSAGRISRLGSPLPAL